MLSAVANRIGSFISISVSRRYRPKPNQAIRQYFQKSFHSNNSKNQSMVRMINTYSINFKQETDWIFPSKKCI